MASRPGKYAHITGGLPKFPGVEPERRAIIETVQAEILASPNALEGPTTESVLTDIDGDIFYLLGAMKRVAAGKRHASAFAAAYAELRLIKDRVNDWLSNVQLLLDAYELLMIEQMEVEGVASLRMDTGASVSTHVEPYGTVVDKEKFRQWCVDNGYEAQLQLWPSTMNSLTKERLLEGEPPPDGVEVFAKTLVRLNKA